MNQTTPIHQTLPLAEQPKSLYSLKAIALGTFFGGPLAAGFLMRRNSLNLGNSQQGFNALMIGILLTFIVVSLAMVIPDNVNDNAIGSFLSAIYALIIYFIANRMHGKELKEHALEKLPFYSGWRAFGVGVGSGLLTLAFIVVLAMMVDDTVGYPGQELVQQEFDQFIANESQAIAYLDFTLEMDESKVSDQLRKGINLWINNSDITHNILQMEDIPDEIKDLSQKLGDYSQLRIQQYNLILKSLPYLHGGRNPHDMQLDLVNLKIESLLEELQ